MQARNRRKASCKFNLGRNNHDQNAQITFSAFRSYVFDCGRIFGHRTDFYETYDRTTINVRWQITRRLNL